MWWKDVAIFTLFVGWDALLVMFQLLLCWTFFWTPGAPIVINDFQLCRTIAEAPRHIPHQIVPQLLFHKLHNKHTGLCWRLFVLDWTLCFSAGKVTDSSIHRWSFNDHFIVHRPCVLFAVAHFESCVLPPALCSSHLHFLVSWCLTASKAWCMFSAFTFLQPLIYAVSFPSVWMARPSRVCIAVSWGVDAFLQVQYQTDCSR